MVLSAASSIGACLLICRLYGTLVAFTFAIVSLEWLQTSVIGASEPLFTALLLGSFFFARNEQWHAAALLGSLATTVRCVGVFALLAIGIVMIRRNKLSELVPCVSIAAIIAAAYFWFAHQITGDAFVNFRLYRAEVWNSSSPVTVPFSMLVPSFEAMAENRYLAHFLRHFGYFLFTLAISVAGLIRGSLRLFRTNPVEAATAAMYLGFLVSYNYGLADAWPRFILPILPVALYAVKDWLPKSRFLLWPSIVISALLASSDFMGFKTIFGFSLHR